MPRLFGMLSVIGLAAALIPSIILAGETHKFKLQLETSVQGLQLKPGRYELALADDNNEALIYFRGKLVAKVRVKVRARNNERPNTVVHSSDGKLMEIRLKDQVVVFVR